MTFPEPGGMMAGLISPKPRPVGLDARCTTLVLPASVNQARRISLPCCVTESRRAKRTGTQAENSEVLWFGSVAVAVTNWPDRIGEESTAMKLALQAASVRASALPRKVLPWP